jgi:hypothetical protein
MNLLQQLQQMSGAMKFGGRVGRSNTFPIKRHKPKAKAGIVAPSAFARGFVWRASQPNRTFS